MPRLRQFDERQVLEQAVRLFLRSGYHATSTRELGEALGLNPSSLYRTFGDKRGLYLRALDRYLESEGERAAAVLAEPGSVRDRLRALMLITINELPGQTADTTFGCLVLNTASELGASDPEASRRIHAAFGGAKAGVSQLLQHGIQTGELPADTDATAVADLVSTTLIGLRVRKRAGETTAALHATVDCAIRALG
jgi:TetR/AcrR family transcriptional regulator, transcriptional repressor for nem operon